ncbi:MAG TPA: hypothetical protein HA348_00055, partial [Thermoplasmata archaeon]|nr:hypothetical protein [Thermoplasmata archaeon]
RFYGFGERFNSLDQRGNTLEMWNMDPPKTFGTSTYVSVPFFMDLRNDKEGISCYGIYLNSSTKSQFKMCSDLMKDYQIVAESNTLEYHFIYGEDMKEVLSRYTGLTGRPALPPRWVFGPWKSRDAHYSEKDVYEDVNMMRRLDIPMSVLVIDSPWDTAFNDFEFNPKQFPNAQEMIDYIHGMGNKLVLWITPFTNVRS